MAYSPGSKLTSANKKLLATVLTGSNVIVTKGFAKGQIIKLDDWLILAPPSASNTTTGQMWADFGRQLTDLERSTVDNLMADLSFNKPLHQPTDPLKLAYLESRFPGGEFVLSTKSEQMDVSYAQTPAGHDHIVLKRTKPHTDTWCFSFDEIPDATNRSGRPNLLVVYMHQYIDLSYLWP